MGRKERKKEKNLPNIHPARTMELMGSGFYTGNEEKRKKKKKEKKERKKRREKRKEKKEISRIKVMPLVFLLGPVGRPTVYG